MKKTLLILGHPDNDSFCGALADEYQKGAEEAGVELERLNLSELSFDPVLKSGYRVIQELEPDLKKAQELIMWAEHIVFVYPTWWASMPALLKGFIDRVFLPGFAFKYLGDGPWWDKLLKGRSARIISTMDAPRIYFFFVYFNAGINAMKRATLYYCGIKPVELTIFSKVKNSDAAKREKWKQKVFELGTTAA